MRLSRGVVPVLGPSAGRGYRGYMKSVHAPEYQALLSWLKESREAKGLSQRAVGTLLGVPHTWVSKVELGERRLDVAEFVRLCEALGADPHGGVDVVRRAGGYPERPATAMPLAAEKRLRYERPAGR